MYWWRTWYYLKDKEAGVEDAWVYEDGAKLATLEELVSVLQEKVVWIEHDNPIIVEQAPSIELVHG